MSMVKKEMYIVIFSIFQ